MRCVLLDYGAGNLHSVTKAFTQAGFDLTVSTDPATIADADFVVIPGVGHFGQCVSQFNQAGFADEIRARLAAGRPVLGICVGLQILFDSSDEAPGVPGLGIVPGVVSRIPNETATNERIIVPHMGWNQLEITDTESQFAQFDGEYVYFVHSYYAQAHDQDHVLAQVTHGDVTIPAIIRNGSLMATQFHPEKSGAVGQAILRTIKDNL